MEANFTTEGNKYYTVTESGYDYRMPFILKYVLDKKLVYIEEGSVSRPVEKWYLSLSRDRQLLIEVSQSDRIAFNEKSF